MVAHYKNTLIIIHNIFFKRCHLALANQFIIVTFLYLYKHTVLILCFYLIYKGRRQYELTSPGDDNVMRREKET